MPIADRELRVAARSKATRWARVGFALGAVAVAGALGLISMAAGGILANSLGTYIFQTLRWSAFIYASCAGLFLTSDCLSEEKRDGTLGLLFLTDLRGYDVVFGKLAATSLRGFFSLLAIFPVMGFSFFLGGVAADDFQHSLIALCNTLFFSLALGLLVSVFSRETHKAMTATAAIMAALDMLYRVTWFSPTYAFIYTNSNHARDFWRATLWLHASAWNFLILASALVKRTWSDSASARGKVFGRATRREREWRERNPIGWIVARDRWASIISRLIALLALAIFVVSVVSVVREGPQTIAAAPTFRVKSFSATNASGRSRATSTTVVFSNRIATNTPYRIVNTCSTVLSLGLELWIVAHIARFYIEAQKSGFFELLLVTPIQADAIVKGHWAGLRRLFLLPVAMQVLLASAVDAVEILGHSGAPGSGVGSLQMILTFIVGMTSWVVGMFCLAWFSIWMGLASKKIPTAMLKTFCYTKILPWFGATFATGLLAFPMMRIIGSSGVVSGWFILITAMPGMLLIITSCGLIRMARRNIPHAFARFRARA